MTSMIFPSWSIASPWAYFSFKVSGPIRCLGARRYVSSGITYSLSLSFNPHQYLPKYPSTESSGHTQIPCPKSSSSFPSRLTYHWYSPLAYIGWRRALALSDVWSIREHFRADYLYALYQQCYDARSKDNFGQHNSASRTAHSFHLNTLRIIWSTLGVYFVGGAVFKLLHDMFMFINPIIMMYVGHTLPVGGNVFVF